MVSKTGLLLSLLSKRQESEGAFDLMGQCPIDENISRRTALEKVKKHRGEKKQESLDDTITLVVLLSVLAVISLTVMCVLKLCSRPCAVFCQCLCTVWRSFLVILRRWWRKNKYKKLEDVEDFPELSENDLLVAQYIMDVLDKEEEESRKERQQGNTDASQKQTECQELHLQEGEEVNGRSLRITQTQDAPVRTLPCLQHPKIWATDSVTPLCREDAAGGCHAQDTLRSFPGTWEWGWDALGPSKLLPGDLGTGGWE
ncbi:uncharacterized protein LOC113959119 [Corapipo altera]|uniref:uncharacterized protein LOC113959119 n=1 Tax=Corapipo altera TaxID=415028 RepID=UPI000FD6274F|nr:uncharacterized protein LOC113959119 [Corapipo altera]